MSLNTNEEIKNFCLKIIKSESADDIRALLEKQGLWKDKSVWRFYGDKSNNISTINNQAPDPTKALVEKIANSFDARLMLECKKRGIDPKSKDTPKNIKEAMQQFFYEGDKFPNFMSLENETIIFASLLNIENESLRINDTIRTQAAIILIMINGYKKS